MKVYVFVYIETSTQVPKQESLKPDLISLLSTWINPGHDDSGLEHLTETKCNSHKRYSIVNLDES